jgi:hypothetical protein
MLQHYTGLFLKGHETEMLEQQNISMDIIKKFFIRCLNDPQKLQINALNKEQLEGNISRSEITDDTKNKIIELFQNNKMNATEVKNKCVENRHYMDDIFKCWNESSMKNFTLTSVGIALGHANIKRFAGEFSDLRIWIN